MLILCSVERITGDLLDVRNKISELNFESNMMNNLKTINCNKLFKALLHSTVANKIYSLTIAELTSNLSIKPKRIHLPKNVNYITRNTRVRPF